MDKIDHSNSVMTLRIDSLKALLLSLTLGFLGIILLLSVFDSRTIVLASHRENKLKSSLLKRKERKGYYGQQPLCLIRYKTPLQRMFFSFGKKQSHPKPEKTILNLSLRVLSSVCIFSALCRFPFAWELKVV